MNSRIALLASLCFLSPLSADEITTPTLTLESVFSMSAPAPSATPTAQGGAMLIIPDTSSWRMVTTPSPTPSPTPTPTSTPSPADTLPIPIIERFRTVDRRFRESDETGLESQGTTALGIPRDHSLIEITTEYLHLRSEYRLIPTTRDGEGEAILLRHGPETSETFSVPAGRYKLQRRIWTIEKPDNFLDETFREIRLDRGVHYRYIARRGEEQATISRMNR